MSTIPTIINQATLIQGRQHFAPARSSSFPMNRCADQGLLVERIVASIKRRTEEQTASIAVPDFVFRWLDTQAYDRSEVTQITAAWTRGRPRPPLLKLYERGEPMPLDDDGNRKIYRNDSEEDSWQPRIEMFSVAMGSGQRFNNIFSLSVLPTDPQEEQTFYYKHSFVEESVEPDYRGMLYLRGRSDAEAVNPLATRAPVLRGSLAPYPTFSSNLFSPDVQPDALPESLSPLHISTEEDIDFFTSDIESADLRNRVKSIASAFLEDVHSQAILLSTLHPSHTPASPLKKLLFVKG